jgi:hypothetical protein
VELLGAFFIAFYFLTLPVMSSTKSVLIGHKENSLSHSVDRKLLDKKCSQQSQELEQWGQLSAQTLDLYIYLFLKSF